MPNPSGKGGFKKAQTGIPAGRPTKDNGVSHIKDVAREYSDETILALVDEAKSGKRAPRVSAGKVEIPTTLRLASTGPVRIVSQDISEEDAFRLERDLIANGVGLLNIAPGGEGRSRGGEFLRGAWDALLMLEKMKSAAQIQREGLVTYSDGSVEGPTARLRFHKWMKKSLESVMARSWLEYERLSGGNLLSGSMSEE